jgi:glycerol-3-phosphate dehydrogenase
MRIERDLARLTEPFDLIVIGGGITGVCVAREAAGRGLRTLLIEKDDFGGGTSAATSKYLHGGIRYLETYEFRVVRESLRERRVLALAAPHLVRQTRFLMPAWRWSKPNAPLIGAGVALYDLLSFDRNRDAPDSLKIPHPRWIRKKALLRAVPWLDPDGLHGAFAYSDTFNLHPERLLLAFLKSAVQAGAVAINHVQARGFVTAPVSGDQIAVLGVEVEDLLTDDRFTVRARAVVNAAGPWMDVVLRELGRPVGVSVRRSKGVHLLTRPLGGDDTVFARARSGRHVIVSPWEGYSFIGPTDTAIEAEPDDVRAEHEDVRQLLDTVNSTLAPGVAHLQEDDVEATTVGIRPLVVDEGVDSYHTSRRHELFDHAQTGVMNLWSIGGGKWTTGRATGEETVAALLRSTSLHGVRARKFDSRTASAAGTFAWAEDAEGYLDEAVRSRPRLPLAPQVRMHLARLYGTEHERILDLVERDPALGRRLSSRDGRWDIAAQAVFAVTDEAARTLSDVLDRRLVLGTLGRLSRDEIANAVEVVAPLLGWSEGAASAAIDVECARRAALEARWRHPG